MSIPRTLPAIHARATACVLRYAGAALLTTTWGAVSAAGCQAVSGAHRTPVIELYTSEGCSSCPPADRWLSTLKGQAVVAQAFHVAYWDYIGWKDRFATPVHADRQRTLARANRLSGIYTPQVVRNGRDWPQWRQRPISTAAGAETARASIRIQRGADAHSFEAHVTPLTPALSWSAYWTVTEHGHQSRVTAGENAGTLLKQDFVVRQYVPVGQYAGARTLRFHAIAPTAGHPQQINLVVSDAGTGEPLQAISLACD